MSRPLNRRQGATTIELVAAGALLAVVSLVVVPFLAKVVEVRENLHQREFALRELRNLAERAMTGHDALALSPDVSEFLTDPELSVTRSRLPDQELEVVTLSLTWTNTARQQVQPIRLSVWRPPL